MLYRLSHLILRNFESKIYPFGIVFQFGWVVKTFKFSELFYDSSFVFGSTGFDPSYFFELFYDSSFVFGSTGFDPSYFFQVIFSNIIFQKCFDFSLFFLLLCCGAMYNFFCIASVAKLRFASVFKFQISFFADGFWVSFLD